MIVLSRDGGSFGSIGRVWFFTYLVAAAGVFLIVYAVRKR